MGVFVLGAPIGVFERKPLWDLSIGCGMPPARHFLQNLGNGIPGALQYFNHD